MPFVDGTEARTFYERFGVGPDIVFVSGGGSRGSDWHPYQVPHFSRSFRCTTYDCRGVGKTRRATGRCRGPCRRSRSTSRS